MELLKLLFTGVAAVYFTDQQSNQTPANDIGDNVYLALCNVFNHYLMRCRWKFRHLGKMLVCFLPVN